jgi:hypothetical protein
MATDCRIGLYQSQGGSLRCGPVLSLWSCGDDRQNGPAKMGVVPSLGK